MTVTTKPNQILGRVSLEHVEQPFSVNLLLQRMHASLFGFLGYPGRDMRRDQMTYLLRLHALWAPPSSDPFPVDCFVGWLVKRSRVGFWITGARFCH